MSAPLRHFVADHAGGSEFLSVCWRHVSRLSGAKCRELRAEDTFPHRDCDVCEFDRGALPYRRADLVNAGILLTHVEERP